MKKQLDVFLSSDQDEFKRERNELEKRISKLRSFECKLLERRGASPDTATEASLKAARACNIYVGLFGEDFSELTIEEFRESNKNFKPCFAYVKKLPKTKKRDERLEKFIKTELRDSVKYHEYRGRDNLYKLVVDNLEDYSLELQHMGLEIVKNEKEKAHRYSEEKKSELESKTMVSVDDSSRKLIKDGMMFINQGNNLNAIVSALISIENILKKVLIEARPLERNRYEKAKLGHLVEETLNIGLINPSFESDLREIVLMRNNLFHVGVVPSKRDIEKSLFMLNEIINMLVEIKVSPGLIFTDDFELDKIGSKPSKWETMEQEGKITISYRKGGAEGTSKYVTISSPYGSTDWIKREIEPQEKINISYFIRQDKFGSSGVGAGLLLYSGKERAFWMAIRLKRLDYYNGKYNKICDIDLNKWYKINVKIDCSTSTFQCSVNNKILVTNGMLEKEVPFIDIIKTPSWINQDFWSTSIDQIMIQKNGLV